MRNVACKSREIHNRKIERIALIDRGRERERERERERDPFKSDSHLNRGVGVATPGQAVGRDFESSWWLT